MAKIERYEDLRCWQEARKLVRDVYQIVDDLQKEKEFALSDQLKRAGISTMTNIAEGFSRYHKKDFIRFLDYAQSSVQEVKSLLYVVADIEMAQEKQVKELQQNCDYCQAMILALLKHVKNSIDEPGKVREPQLMYLAEKFLVEEIQ